MKIKIKGEEIELTYSLRTNIIYESIMQEALDLEKATSINVMATLLYANIVAMIQKYKLNLTLSYDEYFDWLDDNGGIKILNEYGYWLANQLQQQYNITPETPEEENDAKKKKKSKKKTS